MKTNDIASSILKEAMAAWVFRPGERRRKVPLEHEKWVSDKLDEIDKLKKKMAKVVKEANDYQRQYRSMKREMKDYIDAMLTGDRSRPYEFEFDDGRKVTVGTAEFRRFADAVWLMLPEKKRK